MRKHIMVAILVAALGVGYILLSPAAVHAETVTTTDQGYSLTLTIYPTEPLGKDEATLTYVSRTNINVKTDNPTGYSLSIATAAGTNDGAMIGQTNASNIIPRHTATIASPTILPETGAWGFTTNLDNFNTRLFSGVPTTLTEIQKTSNAENTDGVTTSLYSGIRVSIAQPADTYTVNIDISVSSNAPPIPNPTITSPTTETIYNAGTANTTLTVTTDNPGTCYYGTATAPTTAMATTGGKSHLQSVTLSNNLTRTYYVRCNAGAGQTYGREVSTKIYVRTATPDAPALSPVNGAMVKIGTTTISMTSSGATCKWGTTAAGATNGSTSGTTRTTTTGTNTLYYSCVAGSGNTASTARTGSWSYTGALPAPAANSYMQDVSAANCAAMAMGDIVTLRDARDNKSYRIKKMPDNKCWMIDNLAYVGGGTNTYGDTVTVGTAGADGTLTEYTSGNGSSGTWTTTTGYTDRHFVSNSNANITLYDGTRCTTSSTGSGVMASVCGNQILYNFCAALGLDGATTPACTSSTPTNTGTGAGYASAGVIGKAGGIGGESKGNISAANQAGINSSTQGSICPAGWRLPAGRVGSSDNNTKNEWAILNGSLYNNTYTATPNTGSGAGYYGYWQPAGTSINASSTNLAGGAFQTVASGYFNPGNGLLSQSTDGYWWTSSLYSPTNAAVTLVGSSYVNPGTYYGYRYRGFAVRCTLP